MPSRLERAADVTRDSLELAAVPAVATLLSFSKIGQALETSPGGGVTFPFPTGLPTLWTYVSLPGGPGGVSVGGPLSLVAFLPLFVVGLLVTSALEAGFLGSLSRRIDGDPPAFTASVRAFTLRMVAVNVIRAAIVFAMLPLMFFPPLAVLVLLVLMYFLYGLPFEIVVADVGVREAIDATVSHALDGGPYAAFGFGHLFAGAVASLLITGVVRNGGLPGILFGTLAVAIPSVFVATYGVLVFRDLRADATAPRTTDDV